MAEEGDLVEYYGTECHACHEMEPIIGKVEKELKVKLVKKECYHNAKNQNEFFKIAEGKCTGLPFYFNKKSKKWICGAVSYDNFKKWAQGE